MTEDMSTHGIGLFGYIILFVIIVWVFGGAFGGAGFGFNRGFGYGPGLNAPDGFGFQNYKATCDAEKAEIINTARTQYLIEQKSAENNAVTTAQANMLATKIDYYKQQDLRDKISERDRVIAQLQNEIFVKDQLAPVTAQLADIRCNMLVRPNVTGVGVACPSAAILNGLGVNSLSNCNCNYGNLV
jgi:hypothetical protein